VGCGIREDSFEQKSFLKDGEKGRLNKEVSMAMKYMAMEIHIP
jgi:hypothetical protein